MNRLRDDRDGLLFCPLIVKRNSKDWRAGEASRITMTTGAHPSYEGMGFEQKTARSHLFRPSARGSLEAAEEEATEAEREGRLRGLFGARKMTPNAPRARATADT